MELKIGRITRRFTIYFMRKKRRFFFSTFISFAIASLFTEVPILWISILGLLMVYSLHSVVALYIFKRMKRLYHKIRNLHYISSLSSENEIRARQRLVRMIILLIYSCGGLLSFTVYQMNKFKYVIHAWLLLLIIAGFIYTFIRIKNIFLTTFFVIITNYILLLTLLVLIMNFLLYLMSLTESSYGDKQFFHEGLKIITYLYLSVGQSFVIPLTILAFSFLVQLPLIYIRPYSLNDHTKFSFKLISLIFGIMAIFVTHYSKGWSQQLYYLLSPEEQAEAWNALSIHSMDEFREYFDWILKKVLLTFTSGTALLYLLLEHKEVQHKNKANKAFDKALIAAQEGNDAEVIKYTKKAIYHGGSTFKIHLLNNTLLNKYLESIKLTVIKRNRKLKKRIIQGLWFLSNDFVKTLNSLKLMVTDSIGESIDLVKSFRDMKATRNKQGYNRMVIIVTLLYIILSGTFVFFFTYLINNNLTQEWFHHTWQALNQKYYSLFPNKVIANHYLFIAFNLIMLLLSLYRLFQKRASWLKPCILVLCMIGQIVIVITGAYYSIWNQLIKLVVLLHFLSYLSEGSQGNQQSNENLKDQKT